MDGSVICGSTFPRLSHGCFEMIVNDPFILLMLGDPSIIVLEIVNVAFFCLRPFTLKWKYFVLASPSFLMLTQAL
jgi:hypothetical protein